MVRFISKRNRRGRLKRIPMRHPRVFQHLKIDFDKGVVTPELTVLFTQDREVNKRDVKIVTEVIEGKRPKTDPDFTKRFVLINPEN